MTKLVRNHSHWGSFYAEVDNGRVVGNAVLFAQRRSRSVAVGSKQFPMLCTLKTRIAQPVVRWRAGSNRPGQP